MRIEDKFLDYLSYLRRTGLTEKTVTEHRRFLFGSISHSVSRTKIKKLKLTDIAKTIEAGKVHGEYGSQRSVVTLRRYLKYLQDTGVRIPFDWRDIKVPQVPEKEKISLTKEELEKIFKNIMTSSAKPQCRLRMRTLFEVLFSTGMRISEALSLTREQFKEIKKTKETIIRGKGGDERIVYFTDRAIEWIERNLKARNDDCPALFINTLGRPLIMVTAKSDLLRHRDEWGIPKRVHFHIVRRTLATLLIEGGADMKSTQTILGHRSPRTTLRYYVTVNRKRAKQVHQRILATI
ncbi:tyrosine-type recombinase/integrase [Patescibacteria group bacterium AH-259-L07]|nr:tyrosine-type recombinase/integrase [Patescibacteria group bacterium AH-259-L07]